MEDLAFLALVELVVGHVRIPQPRDCAPALDGKVKILRRIRLKSPGSVEYFHRYEREILAVGADLFAVGGQADPRRLASGFERGLGYRAAALQRDGFEDAEYLYLLAAKDPKNPLLDVSTVSSLSTFATEPDSIYEFRRRVARAIERP